MDTRVTPLRQDHERAEFRSGNDTLDAYLQRYALQDQARGLAACFVLEVRQHRIAGYYTLSAAEITPATIPRDRARRLPQRRPIPALLLGRLAIAEAEQRRGYGSLLVADALVRAKQIQKDAGCWALVVDAKPEAVSFYARLGFESLTQEPRRLFLVIKEAST